MKRRSLWLVEADQIYPAGPEDILAAVEVTDEMVDAMIERARLDQLGVTRKLARAMIEAVLGPRVRVEKRPSTNWDPA